MGDILNNPKNVIDAALQFEEEGHRILLDARDKATHPLSKAAFEFLANEELKHIETIKAFAGSLEGVGEFNASTLGTPITKRQAGERIRTIFEKLRERLNSTGREAIEERLDIYDAAMEMERRGYQLYEDIANKSEDETTRKLCRFLAGEEACHFELIQDTREFLKQPDAFMAIEERWMTF